MGHTHSSAKVSAFDAPFSEKQWKRNARSTGSVKRLFLKPIRKPIRDTAYWEQRYAGDEVAMANVRGGLQFDWLQRYGHPSEETVLRALILKEFSKNNVSSIGKSMQLLYHGHICVDCADSHPP